MKNNIIFLTFIFLIIGCSNPLNKSICEELTIDEIREVSKKDTSFFTTYKDISELREKLNVSPVLIAEYGIITYKDVCDYVHFDATENYRKEYPQIDSLKQKATEFIEKHNPDSLINIEYVGKGEGWITDYAKFKITSKGETIQKVIFWWGFFDKTENIKDFLYSENVGDFIDSDILNLGIFTQDIVPNKICFEEEPTTGYIPSLTALERDGEIFQYYIDDIVVNDIEIEYRLFDDIPWKRDLLIKRYIDSSFITYSEYKDNMASKEFPLITKMLNELLED